MRFTSLVLAVCASLFARPYANAQPVVEFNADYLANCKDVTPKAFAEKNKDYKLIEVTLRISSKVNGKESDLDALTYKLFDKGKRLYVVDQLPKTELKTTIAEPIVIVEWDGVGSARYVISQGAVGAEGAFKTSKLEFKKLPPMKLVTASGIVERGFGVFFKLKPFDQHTLEGDRSFSCVFKAPKSWRGGCLHAVCEATALDRGFGLLKPTAVKSGLAGFVVACHMEGDSEAEKLAREVTEQQQKLLDEIVNELKKSTMERGWLQTLGEWFALLSRLSPVARASALNVSWIVDAAKMENAPALPKSVLEQREALDRRIKNLEELSSSK